jgi:hypothetical protein
MRVAGQPDGRLTRARRRLVGAAIAPLPLVAIGPVAIVGLADGWRLALLSACAAGAVAAMRLRCSGRAALGVLLAAALLALGGWGPGFDRRPDVAPVHLGHSHGHTHGPKG